MGHQNLSDSVWYFLKHCSKIPLLQAKLRVLHILDEKHPEGLGGVWFGYEYPKSLEVFGGNLSVYLWDEVMCEIYDKTDYGKRKSFTVPDTVQKLTYEYINGNGELIIDEGWFKTS